MIRIENLVFKYDERLVLNAVDLSVNKGQILCLLGPNGSGKTTLLKCLLGVHKALSGSIFVNAHRLESYSHKALAAQVSYVPQKQNATFPFKVVDMVVMGRTCHLNNLSSPQKSDYKLAEEALDYVGIVHLKDQPYTEISGGEAQLVMIARALAQGSPCIVLDEPTAHLDFHNELVILETIRNLVKAGHTVIMATHYPNHAFYFENHDVDTKVVFLQDGEVKFLGRPNDVLNEENLEKIYKIESKILRHENMKHVIPLYTKGRAL